MFEEHAGCHKQEAGDRVHDRWRWVTPQFWVFRERGEISLLSNKCIQQQTSRLCQEFLPTSPCHPKNPSSACSDPHNLCIVCLTSLPKVSPGLLEGPCLPDVSAFRCLSGQHEADGWPGCSATVSLCSFLGRPLLGSAVWITSACMA